MEIEGPFPCSQGPATDTYPDPDSSFPPYFPTIHSHIIFPSTPRSSERHLLYRICNQNILLISHLSHACRMPRLSYTQFDHPNNIWWSVQVMKLLVMQYSAASRHFLPLMSKYSPLKYPQIIRGCIQKFPDWPPGARTADGTALCH
jgi:hypothetical protein